MSTRIVGGDEADREVGVAASSLLTAADLRGWVERSARILVRHRACLDRLDARLGDGDHGENMSVGFGDAARTLQPDDDGREASELLRRLGEMIVAGVGGAGGSLYGTAFMEAGIAVVGRPALDAADLAVALDAAAEGIARRGRCRGGDKTIYDALRPAADAVADAVEQGLALQQVIRCGALAARTGMLATRPLIARRGLALRLGERSRGNLDPGAMSCFLLIRAMLPEHTR